MADLSPREWMDAKEAAAYVGVGVNAFYKYAVHDPTLPSTRIGTRILFRRRNLDEWMRAGLSMEMTRQPFSVGVVRDEGASRVEVVRLLKGGGGS